VFDASLLLPYCETPSHGPNFSQPPPDLINGKEEFEVEQIKAHQNISRSKCLQYLIKWKGYPDSDNIIVGEDDRLWIVDWAWAGYYPPWFEYVAMERQNEDEVVSGTDDKFWKAMVPFICGPYFEQERWLLRMSQGLYFR
jgi:hypothetical protein